MLSNRDILLECADLQQQVSRLCLLTCFTLLLMKYQMLCVCLRHEKVLSKCFVKINIDVQSKSTGRLWQFCSFINEKLAFQLSLKIIPGERAVSMASSARSVITRGYCVVEAKINGKKYSGISVTVMPDLCANIILGHDFLNLHDSVSFKFDGPKRTTLYLQRSTTCYCRSSSSLPKIEP